MYSNPKLTKNALKAQGCIELKDFINQYPYGSCFYTVREFQLDALDSGTSLKMVSYWQFENGNGGRIVLHGDQLVLPTVNQSTPSVYLKNNLTMQKHDDIAKRYA